MENGKKVLRLTYPCRNGLAASTCANGKTGTSNGRICAAMSVIDNTYALGPSEGEASKTCSNPYMLSFSRSEA